MGGNKQNRSSRKGNGPGAQKSAIESNFLGKFDAVRDGAPNDVRRYAERTAANTEAITHLRKASEEIAPLQTAFARLDERLSINLNFFRWSGATLFLTLLAIGGYVYHFDSRVTKLESGTIAAIGDQLSSLAAGPYDALLPSEAREVSSQVVRARVERLNLRSELLIDLGKKLRSSIRTDSDSPAIWHAAAELISYRSQLRDNFRHVQLPNCNETFSFGPLPPPGQMQGGLLMAFLQEVSAHSSLTTGIHSGSPALGRHSLRFRKRIRELRFF